MIVPDYSAVDYDREQKLAPFYQTAERGVI